MARESKNLERNYKEHSITYDQQRFEGKRNKFLEFLRSEVFLSLVPIDKRLEVLDVGCGTGRGTVMLGQKGYSVIGIDYTKEMLRKAKEKRKNLKLTNISFRQGNAKELPFKDNSFGCITSFNFIHMFGLESQKVLINEMARVLKPGGTIIVEFDSFYKGIIMGAILQKMKPSTHLNKPSDLKYLFENEELQIDVVYGTVIPFLYKIRLYQILPSLFLCIERIARFYPFNFLTERFFVKVIKKTTTK